MEKINLKKLYSIFRDTKSHGVVSLHFLCSVGIFFCLWPSIPKYAHTELYQNFSYETLSGTRNHEFESVSDLIGELSFFIKQSTLANIKRKEKDDEKSLQEIEKICNFVEKPDEFSEEVIDGLFKDLEHKKVQHPYVEPQVQDAETIERETKNENDEFLDLYKKFNEVNDAAARQKKGNEAIDLIGNIKDEDNPFDGTFKADLEDIFINDSLFDNFDQNNKKDIKMVSEDENLDQNDALFEEWPTRPVKRQIIKPNARLEFAANKIKRNTRDKEIGKI